MSLQAPVMVTVTEVTADVSAATLGVSVYLQARDEAARSATTRPHASGRAQPPPGPTRADARYYASANCRRCCCISSEKTRARKLSVCLYLKQPRCEGKRDGGRKRGERVRVGCIRPLEQQEDASASEEENFTRKYRRRHRFQVISARCADSQRLPV